MTHWLEGENLYYILLILIIIVAALLIVTSSCAAKVEPKNAENFTMPQFPAPQTLATTTVTTTTYTPQPETPQRELVLYYADWCGYCKIFMPIWDRFASTINGDGTNQLHIRKVNCEQNQETCNKEGVSVFPTVILYDNGTKRVFNGARTIDSLKQFIA